MNRRSLFKVFGATAAGLLIPIETQRVYSFCGGWAVDWLDDVKDGDRVLARYGIRGTNLEAWRDTEVGFFRFLIVGPGAMAPHRLNTAITSEVSGRLCGRKVDEYTAREACRIVRSLV